jgi:hypothetical protein
MRAWGSKTRLARAFRSIVLAFEAALLNPVSLAAAFGVVVFVFQQDTAPSSGTPTRPSPSSPGSR